MAIMGDTYPQRETSDQPNRFVRLIGEKGKVLLTFLTEAIGAAPDHSTTMNLGGRN